MHLINAGRVLQLIPSGCIWGMPIWPATRKGIDIMTIECSAIQCFQTLDLSPALRAEILECGAKIAPLLYPRRIVAQPLKEFDGEGFPVAGGKFETWILRKKELLEATVGGESRLCIWSAYEKKDVVD